MTHPFLTINQIGKQFGDESALNEINLSIQQGEFLTLLGPSGCGKSTLLRILAGFESPDVGNLFLKGHNITSLPPEQRHINMIFQSYALFPHMSIFDNVAFGLRCHGVSEADVKVRVEEMLNIVQMTKYTHRKPEQLSGGQQQRIAIARAAVNEPNLLLLDEPLSALDYQLRKSMRIELKKLQRKLGITFIFVTHDQEEALSISDRIVVMNHGHIEQIGTPRDIYEGPINLYVAKFIGETNLFYSSISTCSDKKLTVSIEGQDFECNNKKNFKQGEHVAILIRPEDIEVWHEKEIDDSTNMLPAIVEEVIYKGSTVDLIVKSESGQRLAATEFFDEDDEDLTYHLNEKVWIRWVPGWEVIYPNER